jgi:hypothetical protein
MKTYNTSVLRTLLYGCETRKIREQRKYRITSAETKLMRTAKYTWQNYKSNDDILLELKINSFVKENAKEQKYMNTTCSANGQRQTAILNYELSTMWETNPKTTPLTSSRLLMGSELVTRPKTLQAT